MNIYQSASVAKGFTSWSLAQKRRRNDDTPPGGATPIGLACPDPPAPVVVRASFALRTAFR